MKKVQRCPAGWPKHNFFQVGEFVDRADPDKSPLLIKALQPHGGRDLAVWKADSPHYHQNSQAGSFTWRIAKIVTPQPTTAAEPTDGRVNRTQPDRSLNICRQFPAIHANLPTRLYRATHMIQKSSTANSENRNLEPPPQIEPNSELPMLPGAPIPPEFRRSTDFPK